MGKMDRRTRSTCNGCKAFLTRLLLPASLLLNLFYFITYLPGCNIVVLKPYFIEGSSFVIAKQHVATSPSAPVVVKQDFAPVKEGKIVVPDSKNLRGNNEAPEPPKKETPSSPPAPPAKKEEPKSEPQKKEAPPARPAKKEEPKSEPPKKQATPAPPAKKEEPKSEPPKKEAPPALPAKKEEPKSETPKKEAPPAPPAKKEEPKSEPPKKEAPPAPPVKTEPKKNEVKVPDPGPESTFNWADVVLTEKGACGYDKCFFKSKSNSTIGYLVANSFSANVMRKATDVALDLHARFNAKHFHLSLTNDTCSKEFREYLNTLVVQPSRVKRGEEMLPIFTMSGKSILVIETVIKAPEPFFFLRTYPSRCQNILDTVDDFLAQVPNKPAMHKQLQKEDQLLRKIWADNPTLVRDFQAMIDVEGNLYYIDLDGHIRQQHSAEKNGNGDVTTYYHKSLGCLDKIVAALMEQEIRTADV